MSRKSPSGGAASNMPWRPEASNHIHEPLQVEVYGQRGILPDLLGHTSACMMRFLIPSFFIFLVLFSFLSLENSFIWGWSAEAEGRHKSLGNEWDQ